MVKIAYAEIIKLAVNGRETWVFGEDINKEFSVIDVWESAAKPEVTYMDVVKIIFSPTYVSANFARQASILCAEAAYTKTPSEIGRRLIDAAINGQKRELEKAKSIAGQRPANEVPYSITNVGYYDPYRAAINCTVQLHREYPDIFGEIWEQIKTMLEDGYKTGDVF